MTTTAVGTEVYRRTARETGTVVTIERSGEGHWLTPHEGWITICLAHSTFCEHDTRRLAKSFASVPTQWCEACAGGEPAEDEGDGSPALHSDTPASIDARLATLDGTYVAAVTAAVQAEQAARRASTGRFADARYAATLTERAQGHRAEAARIAEEMAPLNAEFTRRGGWTRAFIVAGGHVHSSQACSTCHKGALPTRFGWLTEFSGKTQAEVIEAAGSRACTVCYPDAPVDAPAGRLFHADEVAAQQARDERASKAAAKAEKRAANALPLYRTTGSWSERIETVHQAKAFLTDGAQWGWDHPSFIPADRDAVAALLAEKQGTTAAEEVAAASKRASKRR